MKKIISTILTFAMLLSMITIVQAADFSGGGYNFVCADGGRYLNVYAGKDADGTNVCVWEKDGSPEQNYTISACGGGKYKLYPASSSSRVIDVNRGNSYSNPLKAGLNVDLWRTNDAPAQEFYITHVGNNLYKIELAALSGHVLQANNPNKNNGNVTLERYTGAANQHWKILKNGTQVVEPCTHKNVSNRNEKTEIKQKDDSAHTVINTYNRVCNDCDAIVEKNVSTSKTVNHQINNGICSECGYKEPVKEVVQETTKVPEKETEEKCNHSRTYDGEVKSTEVSVKNDEYHTVEETYDVYCYDCDTRIKSDAKKAYSEKHTLNNDACTVCSFAVEKEVCKHENTTKHHVDNSETYAKKNDSVHSITKLYDVFCVDCQTYIQKGLSETSDEAHHISNYKCGACGYQQPTHSKTVADGLYNIKNVSSGYMMNVYAGKDANGTKVTMWENDNSTDQKIYIAHQGDGKYLLKFNASSGGRVIDVNRGNSITASIDDGDKIDIWTANDLDAQLFYINDCGNGKYTFELVSKPGYVISPVNASAAKQNGSQLELKKDVNADYQRWNIVTPTTTISSNNVRDKYQSIVNNVGWQTKQNYRNWAYMCGCYCTAYAHSYISGKIHKPSEYWLNENDATTHWYRAGGSSSYKSNNSQVLAAAKASIDSGKPCVVKVYSSFAGQHYLLVISYSGNGTSQSNFTVIDPYDGKFKSLSNYTIHQTSKQVITF